MPFVIFQFLPGGKIPLQDLELLRPQRSTAIPPIRNEIKWVFTVPREMQNFDLTYNTTMAALRSAKARTSLIPVCITWADPMSEIAVLLVSMGVRVIYHKPSWQEQVTALVTGFYSERALPKAIDEVVSNLLHIDIPAVGILDYLVLYTDSRRVF